MTVMRVIGTAGHVDHGKSTLVRRLTGIDPDRLAEEQARAMTIDLGFAWLTLADGSTLGIVDVPGHRDFIENMLAGIGGIDAVVLVIAADEGVMPQTREHLAILDLLGVGHGLIALTKSDLVDDDWLALVEAETRAFLAGTALANAPIVPLSAQTGAGIDAFLATLATVLANLPPRAEHGTPRLPIDRVFTMTGFGAVVTGTLIGGSLQTGDEVALQPTGLRARVRGLQSYRSPVQTALPGSRVAVNLAGVDKSAVARGHVLTRPGALDGTILADAHYRHLPDASRPLKHNAEVKVFTGAAETTARVRLLGDEVLAPGADGWIQLRLETPLALARGDRFILRFPSPAETIGGGVFVDPHPLRRWRRFQASVVAALETRLSGDPAERMAQAADGPEPAPRAALAQTLGLGVADFEAPLADALARGLLVALPGDRYMSARGFQASLDRLIAEVNAFHEREPLRAGMPREELRRRAGLKGEALAALLARQDRLIDNGPLVRLREHRIAFTSAQQARVDALMAQCKAAPYMPPSFAEAVSLIGEDVLRALIDLGEIVHVQPDVIFTRAAYEAMVAGALEMIDRDGGLTASAFRDRFGTTRKYAIGLLEHLDERGVTRREGEARVRGERPN